MEQQQSAAALSSSGYLQIQPQQSMPNSSTGAQTTYQGHNQQHGVAIYTQQQGRQGRQGQQQHQLQQAPTGQLQSQQYPGIYGGVYGGAVVGQRSTSARFSPY
jgi:hypothetical protein